MVETWLTYFANSQDLQTNYNHQLTLLNPDDQLPNVNKFFHEQYLVGQLANATSLRYAKLDGGLQLWRSDKV